MTPEQAAALRAPFPPEVIGKLPKPLKADAPKGKCQECGGYHGLPAVHLDYVGHAASTDRLLQVDPSWTWEPLGLDAQGLPAMDAAGNLWIRLTVAGVTRIGVGDGKSMKERVGDAIRNSAMRFGVALDLWAKEDLQVMHDGTDEPKPARAPRRKPEPPESVSPSEPYYPPDDANEDGLTDRQRTKLVILMNEAGITEKADVLSWCESVIGRPIATRKELTKDEASQCIKRLDPPADPWASPEETP